MWLALEKLGVPEQTIQLIRSLVTGRLVKKEVLAPIALEGGEVEAVEELPYLRSLVDSSGKMQM